MDRVAALVGMSVASILLGCSMQSPGRECNRTDDCRLEEACIFDVDRGDQYCADRCAVDEDCVSHRQCRDGWCVERVRRCTDDEPCNGLDDDCDGARDGEGCRELRGCLDDSTCGAFVCRAPEGAPDTVCAEPNENAGSYGALCTDDEACPNGICAAGVCGPFCRANTACASGRVCAEATRTSRRPRHNQCLSVCASGRDCIPPTECVWRDAYPSELELHSVCALPDRSLKPLGEACTNNERDGGDGECQHGLCYGLTCTRFCSGPDDDCRDVGPTSSCQAIVLFYGTREYRRFVCVGDA